MVLGVFKQEAYGTQECLNKKYMVLGVLKQEAYANWTVLSRSKQ